MFALADANNFYASCETVFRPDLRGRPIVVVSNNDGCVIARSAEAKRMGIKMAAPLFQNERFFRENGVHVFSSNYELYGDMSSRMMAILGEMAAGQEVYSIEGFEGQRNENVQQEYNKLIVFIIQVFFNLYYVSVWMLSPQLRQTCLQLHRRRVVKLLYPAMCRESNG